MACRSVSFLQSPSHVAVGHFAVMPWTVLHSSRTWHRLLPSFEGPWPCSFLDWLLLFCHILASVSFPQLGLSQLTLSTSTTLDHSTMLLSFLDCFAIDIYLLILFFNIYVFIRISKLYKDNDHICFIHFMAPGHSIMPGE